MEIWINKGVSLFVEKFEIPNALALVHLSVYCFLSLYTCASFSIILLLVCLIDIHHLSNSQVLYQTSANSYTSIDIILSTTNLIILVFRQTHVNASVVLLVLLIVLAMQCLLKLALVIHPV